jgi:Recombination endonuclease VII
MSAHSTASSAYVAAAEPVSGKQSVTEEPACGKWMPRAGAYCGRSQGHPPGTCSSPKAMERARQRQAEKVRAKGRVVLPDAKRRWNQAYQLSRYNLTQERFRQLLEIQGHACAMGGEPFAEDSVIFVDHDHNCCDTEKASCGKCVRGLLCRTCNTALGHIERKGDLARAYLANPPAALPAA